MAHHLLPEFGDQSLEAITSERVDAYRARLVAEGKLSARTINKTLIVMGPVFRRAQRVYGLPYNPVRGIERQPDKRSGDIDVLAPAEVEALAEAAASEQDAALFRVAAFTGLRLGELRALRWSDIDFTKRLLHVRRDYTANTLGVPKSGKVRSVPLIDQAARALHGLSRREHFIDPDDLVFIGEAGGYFDESGIAPSPADRARPGQAEADSLPRPAPHLRDHRGAGVPALRCAGDDGAHQHRKPR